MPTGIKPNWEDNNAWNQSLLIAYSQVRDYEASDLETE
jgi:hypothetical protein